MFYVSNFLCNIRHSLLVAFKIVSKKNNTQKKWKKD